MEDDEPELKSISNCLKDEIVITPEICKKFWEYRADSGHLGHLLYDLLGEEFCDTHSQDECVRVVLEEWRSPEERKRFIKALVHQIKRDIFKSLTLTKTEKEVIRAIIARTLRESLRSDQ